MTRLINERVLKMNSNPHINKDDWVIIQLNTFGRVMKSLSDLKVN